MTLKRSDFGEGFTWGVASAAFQVEGAWDTDGKRPSVWDDAVLRGRVRGGLAGLDGIDAFNRLDEDLDPGEFALRGHDAGPDGRPSAS